MGWKWLRRKTTGTISGRQCIRKEAEKMGGKENETDSSRVGNEEWGTEGAQSQCLCRHQMVPVFGEPLKGIKDVGAPGEWDLSQPCRH